MKRDLNSMSQVGFDLLIVGGGIYGACAAWEAASRGLKTALVEKVDFGHASSANHLKMVHGGIRYLQHGDIPRIRESSKERSALLRIAPHLVEPLPILIPTYGHGMKGKEVLRAGMMAYDLITFDRNKNISDPSRHIPRGRFLNAREVLDVLPGLPKSKLTGAAVFYDGQMFNPPRLTMSFLRSAEEEGAVIANYAELSSLDIKNGTVVGATVKDLLNGGEVSIDCRNVLLTSGGWTHQLLEKLISSSLDPAPAFSRDLAFVINRSLVQKYGFACPLKTKDADAMFDRGGRHLFVAPWRGKTLVGVWHGIFKKSPEEVATSEEELQKFLNEVNDAYPDFRLTLDDIAMVLTGLTLFGESNAQSDGKMSFGKRSLLIDHALCDQVEGLISLIGVRATTARGMAEQAIELVLNKLGKKQGSSLSDQKPIYGGDFSSIDELRKNIEKESPDSLDKDIQYELLRNYGTGFKRVYDNGGNDLGLFQRIGHSNVIGAEIVHGVREEMAVKLGDIVFRRTSLGTQGDLSDDQIDFCGQIMAKELAWDEETKNKEIASVKKHIARRGFVTA